MLDQGGADVSLEDHRDAAAIATEAGRVLLELRERGLPPAELKAAGDAHSQRYIAEALASRHPGDAVLSEEAADDAVRLSSTRVWIVDPLDGTREYSEVPRVDWAVHVALLIDGELAAGAVALPAGDHLVDRRAAHAADGDRRAHPAVGQPDQTHRARRRAG